MFAVKIEKSSFKIDNSSTTLKSSESQGKFFNVNKIS